MRNARPALAVAIVTAIFYIPGMGGDFLPWDDWSNFTQNPDYRGLSPRHLGWMFSTFHMGHWQPLTWITLGLDYSFWGMDAFGYHLTSLVLHAVSAALLFDLLRALTSSPAAAAIGALFWSIHPLRVESVTWITERRDVLCGVFFLLSLLGYLGMCRARERGGPCVRWLAFSVGAYAASLMSKSLGIMLPLLLLLMDFYPLRRVRAGMRRRILLEKLPYVACAVAVFLVTLAAMKDLGQVRATIAPLDRAAQAAFGACFYLWKTLLPWNLSPLYPIEQGIDPGQARFVVCLIAAPLLTAGLALLARKRPAPFAAWAAYLLLAAPVLGAVVRGPQLAADRYTYLSMLPFSLLLAAGLRPLLESAPRRTRAAAAVLLLGLGTLTAFQTRIWSSPLALWNHAIDSGWGGAIAYTNRGAERFRANDLAAARADFDEAIRRNPGHGLAWLNRGKLSEIQKERRRALEDYDRAAACEMRSPDALERRAAVREALGDPAGARADYDEAIRRFPAAGTAWIARAKLRLRSGETRAAIADFDEGLRRNPRDAVAFYERGCARAFTNDAEGAWKDFSAALGLDPGLHGAHLNRGALLGQRGDFKGADAEFSEEIRLDPGSLDAWRQRALARMKLGAHAGAAADFQRVLELAPSGWEGRREVENWILELRKN